MEPVKWGILGIGRHFITRIAEPLKQTENVNLYAVASRDLNKAAQTAEKFGIPHYYGSYEDLLKDKNVEAVFITLPNLLHLEWIKKAANHGKHILCEKPITLDAKDANEALDYTAKKGVMLMEAFMYRFHPQWAKAKELVKYENIGKPQAVQVFFSYTNKDAGNIRNNPELGGGGIYDIGCYAVSVARFIIGKEPKRVISLINRDPEFKVDVLSSGILDFGEEHSIFTVGTQIFPFQRVEIIGTGGKITIILPFNTFPDVPAKIVVSNGVGTREIEFDSTDHYDIQFSKFSEALRNGEMPPTPAVDAVNNMAVLDALFRSEKSNGWEDVKLP